jgi:hypothetical protein
MNVESLRLNKDQIIAMYASRMTSKEIGGVIGCDYRRILEALSAWNVPRIRGPNSGKNGRFLRHGYTWLYMPRHPMADSKGCIAEHRLVMAEHLGRMLTQKEVVHHINGVITDNRIQNLELFPTGEHLYLHKGKPLVEEQIKKLFEQGFKNKEISEILKMKKSAVSYWLLKLGVNQKRINVNQWEIVRCLYVSGLSCKDISIKTGIKDGTIECFIKREGISRTLSEAQILRHKRLRAA